MFGYIHHCVFLQESGLHWQKQALLSVFVPGPEFDVAQAFISYLRSCNQVDKNFVTKYKFNVLILFDCNSFSMQEVRERVAFSLSHPLNLPPQAAGI